MMSDKNTNLKEQDILQADTDSFLRKIEVGRSLLG
jgi:hypothetical protein